MRIVASTSNAAPNASSIPPARDCGPLLEPLNARCRAATEVVGRTVLVVAGRAVVDVVVTARAVVDVVDAGVVVLVVVPPPPPVVVVVRLTRVVDVVAGSLVVVEHTVVGG
jgi:hypothetical protein